jgi:DNA-directed RNA polymerase subunit RPC12/RpoP
MDKINCLVCGKPLRLPSYVVDSEQYDGEVRCEICFARLHLKLVGSKVQKYKVVSTDQSPLTIKALYEIIEKHSEWDERYRKKQEESGESLE